MKVTDPGGSYEPTEYTLIGAVPTFRVNQNNTTTAIVELTAYSPLYGVQYTWDVLKTTFDVDGAKNLAEQKTKEVNAVAAADHVQALRSEKEQDKSGLLYNYLVITVGTDDQAITLDVTRRMDQLDNPATFAAIDSAWKLLVNSGAPENG